MVWKCINSVYSLEESYGPESTWILISDMSGRDLLVSYWNVRPFLDMAWETKRKKARSLSLEALLALSYHSGKLSWGAWLYGIGKQLFQTLAIRILFSTETDPKGCLIHMYMRDWVRDWFIFRNCGGLTSLESAV